MEFDFLEHWPKDAAGVPEKAALLCTETDIPGNIAIFSSMLSSFGIPYYAKRRGADEYLNILWGRSIMGVEVYVPASRLEEAKELLNAPPMFDDEMMEEEPEE